MPDEQVAPVVPVSNQLHYNMELPKAFDFGRPDTWKVWIRRFERFRQASELERKSEEYQVNILLYSMGEQSEELKTTLKLSEQELQ